MPSIAVRQYTFEVGPLPFAHNFLVLYDDQGNVLSEFHGNPADPVTREELDKYIGRSSDNLGAFEKERKDPDVRTWPTRKDALARLRRCDGEMAGS